MELYMRNWPKDAERGGNLQHRLELMKRWDAKKKLAQRCPIKPNIIKPFEYDFSQKLPNPVTRHGDPRPNKLFDNMPKSSIEAYVQSWNHRCHYVTERSEPMQLAA